VIFFKEDNERRGSRSEKETPREEREKKKRGRR
jgi:hypothetical protein